MGAAGTLVVAFAVVYALTFLPALLALLGQRVNAWRVLRRKRPTQSGAGFWHRLALGVMKRPVVVLLLALAIVLTAAAPFLHIRLGSGDVNVLPAHAESRRGHELLLTEFPGRDTTTIIVVAKYQDFVRLDDATVGSLYDLSQAIHKLPGVLRIDSIVDLDPNMTRAEAQRLWQSPREAIPPQAQQIEDRSVGITIVALYVHTEGAVASDQARGLVQGIRAMTLPGAQLLVTGSTAFDMDTIAFILHRVPIAVAFIVVVTYVLLLLLVGSVLLPLKAVLMNFLSISASFGALVWIFQDGHLRSFLRFTPASIDPTLPVIMFCIIFGLSMDYEVLMLSRMQEEWTKSRDNTHAVAEGLEKTGQLITGAAAIMVVVFSAFALAEVTIIKAIGLGLALAVAIDATLVRALIVPATMRLLGNLNWWGPAWLSWFRVRGGD
jgi:RND superfamily putative drug exporter